MDVMKLVLWGVSGTVYEHQGGNDDVNEKYGKKGSSL